MDTHIWIWWLNGQDDLAENDRRRLDGLAENGTPPFLSAISLWEAQMLFRKGRLKLEMSFASWLAHASDPEVIRLLPLDVSTILALDKLPESFHGDPADRIIFSTARAYSIELMTEDKAMRRAKLV